MKDLKYLVAYTIPIAAAIGLWQKEIWTFLTPVVSFVIIPILEVILPVDANNLDEEEALSKAKSKFFNMLLYANVPIVFALLYWFFHGLYTIDLLRYELVGLTFSMGIVVGSSGINVAHELGHRNLQWEKTLGKLLLVPAMYMHFFIEHNYGHHLHAATKEDPASARYNQSVYSFWLTSMIGQYVSAWKIQMSLLKRNGRTFFSLKNDMFWYVIIQLVYVLAVMMIFNLKVMIYALVVALVAALLLETINYIEHYGLSRLKLPSGRYERVSEIHSWNSNHVLGRIMLYELTRHSDHHYKSHKKYQLLEYHDVSPQLPYGYPTSMVLSLVPPLWFNIMNPRIPAEMKS